MPSIQGGDVGHLEDAGDHDYEIQPVPCLEKLEGLLIIHFSRAFSFKGFLEASGVGGSVS